MWYFDPCNSSLNYLRNGTTANAPNGIRIIFDVLMSCVCMCVCMYRSINLIVHQFRFLLPFIFCFVSVFVFGRSLNETESHFELALLCVFRFCFCFCWTFLGKEIKCVVIRIANNQTHTPRRRCIYYNFDNNIINKNAYASYMERFWLCRMQVHYLIFRLRYYDNVDKPRVYYLKNSRMSVF